MTEYVTLDELSPRNRRLAGLALITLGLGMATRVALRPEAAKVPLLVIWLICAALVLAGVAVALYSRARPVRYRWAIVGTLASMAAAPVWIALGPGPRACTGTLPMLPSELSCRVVFGIGALLLLLMLAVALRQALARTSSA